MSIKGIIPLFFVLTFSLVSRGQENSDSTILTGKNYLTLSGFIRSGIFGDLKENPGKPFLSSVYGDLAFKLETGYTGKYRFYSDLRLRYGSEFTIPVKDFTMREAFGEVNLGQFNLSLGQRIVKWGRADFTNPTSKLNPQNFISRSTDREDMDMGNIVATVGWHPAKIFDAELVVVPFYKSSVLIIDPVPLPENVSIKEIGPLITGDELYSYGVRADMHLRGIDFGLAWFDGYDPMPGTALGSFNIDLTGPVPVTTTEMEMKPFKLKMAGFDFETSIGSVGLRGEAAWTKPELSYKSFEYVPLEEIKWVAGLDFSIGNFRLTGEYTGKTMPSFTVSDAAPIFGAVMDPAQLALLLSTPGFDMNEYIRSQVAAFNRLYNYQIDRTYHTGGIRLEADLGYGRFLPSVFTMYNFTSRDLLIIPELRIKPVDGLTITAGAEIYYGKKSSLFDVVDNFMSNFYIGIKADF